ncbi:dynein heavy chain 3, axonemal [Plakobranchus ocellatus]|uniref:Dynein heavy chain 3, axonemal n=1 Tax=Plakobranchus ocellatus TaxID=259542 RepID=A0AAV4BVU1_9GAST|nr:dynein heavy chain 3, axonemal [Plakobranchus ocellatus]
MDTDYRGAVRRAILDYILLDLSEQERLGIIMPVKPSNLAGRDGYPWHDSVNKGKEFMANHLFITHPIMRKILYDFEHKYANFRLIDILGLRAIMPVTMETFLKHVQDSSKAGAELLEHRWLSDCTDLIDDMREAVEEWMPADSVRTQNYG